MHTGPEDTLSTRIPFPVAFSQTVRKEIPNVGDTLSPSHTVGQVALGKSSC